MELTIEQSCPGCGASIELHEDDRIVRCSFCEVNNYMVEQGVRRFVLPYSLPDDISERDLFFIPYLRFKGAVLYASSDGFRHKFIDITQLGVDYPNLPIKLEFPFPKDPVFFMLGSRARHHFHDPLDDETPGMDNRDDYFSAPDYVISWYSNNLAELMGISAANRGGTTGLGWRPQAGRGSMA